MTTNPAAVDPALAAAILSQAQHMFTSRRTGPFHVHPGEHLKAAVEPTGLFADPLQFLLQSLDITGVLRNIAPPTTEPTTTIPLPIGVPTGASPEAVAGPLNAALDAVADITRVQPRLRVSVNWRIERIVDSNGTTKAVDEWNTDLDDPAALASPELALRLAPTRAFPLRVADPADDVPLGDVVCLHPALTLTLGETRLRVELPGVLLHVVPVFLPTVLVLTPHPNFGTDKDQPTIIAVPADSPINSIESLQQTVQKLRDQLQPRGIGRFALWAAGLGFLIDLLKVPNPIAFVKGNTVKKLSDFISNANDKANTVALFGAPGACVTLSSRNRLDKPFQAGVDSSDPGLLHLRVGVFGFVACQNLKKTNQGTFHEKNKPRGELLPPQAKLVVPTGGNSATIDAPQADLLDPGPGTITVVESDSKGDGFQDSLTAWTFADINPKDGSTPTAPEPDTVECLVNYSCVRRAAPKVEVFNGAEWVERTEGETEGEGETG